MNKMTRKQKRKFIAQAVLIVIGLIGFFLVLNSIGTLDGDHIVISTQLSLNVRTCVTGFALINLVMGIYKMLFS